MKKFLAMFFLICFNQLDAQITKPPVKAEISDAVERGKAYMDAGDYITANKIFRGILETNQVLPSDMCYYFAETLFMLGQYKNSQNFVDKYLELTGKSGDFYHEVVDLEELLDKKTNVILQCHRCDRNGYIISACEVCHETGLEKVDCHFCQAAGQISCPTCQGKGVQITSGKLDQVQYNTCPTCLGSGYTECPVCKGKLQLEQFCSTCSGSGIQSTTELCTHPDFHEHN